MFEGLRALDPALSGQVIEFIVTGAPAAILSTLATPAAQAAWQNSRGLVGMVFHGPGRQRDTAPGLSPAQCARTGQALAALEPLAGGKHWGKYGTAASPDWLRHAVSFRIERGHPVCTFAALKGMTDASDLGAGPLLDLLPIPTRAPMARTIVSACSQGPRVAR